MFTGIIEGVGRLAGARERAAATCACASTSARLPFDDGAARRKHRRQWRVPDRGRVRRDRVRRRCLQRNAGADHAGRAAARRARSTSNARCARPTASAAIWSAATSTASAACSPSRDDARAQRWRFAAPPALLRYIAQEGLDLRRRRQPDRQRGRRRRLRGRADPAHGRAHRLRADRASAMRSTSKSTWSRATSSACWPAQRAD